MSFVATASPVVRAGAVPVFIDAESNYQPDMNRMIELVESGSVSAVVTAHLYGQLSDITPLADACDSNGVTLIEDAAQAIGATHNGASPGARSIAATISFDPMKVAGAFGSGGAIVTNNSDIADRARRLRYHGRDDSRVYQELGYNSQIASIQAAIVSFKLDHLDEWTERRQNISRSYTSVLDEITSVTTPTESPDARHVFHKYVLASTNDRNRLRTHLSDSGIGTMVHYANSLNTEPVFSKFVSPNDRYPEAERISKEALSLPIYPELNDSEVQYICEQLTTFEW
jgi:dTDP-4-amino-4,6-dideoxygalactose transaminase